jgi:regulator of sirC expression with transglutaminase-like and TPR domain
VLQRLVILLPEAWEERRDRGLAAAQLGAVKAAVADLSTYLEHMPHAGDRSAIHERLLELGPGDPSRLH